MDLHFTIHAQEDIEYIQLLKHETKNKVLEVALSIGLKSIQMSEVNLDCHSYINPIRKIISDTMDGQFEQINDISEKLDNLMHIKSNSSRKGNLSENICRSLLNKKYPQWVFNDVSHENYQGDCRAIESPIGSVLYEFKYYETNINREQISKFHRDLEYTGINYGVFVSNTSGIVGKKNIEWEMKDKKLIIYVSNMGMNGYGCILGTELLLALVENNIHQKDEKWILYQNIELTDIIDNLIDSIDMYKNNIENISKHKYLIRDHRDKLNSLTDHLEKSIFQIELDSEYTFRKIVNLVETIQNGKTALKKLTSNQDFLETIEKKYRILFQKCIQIMEIHNYDIYLKDKELFIQKNEKLITYSKTYKSRVELIFPIYNTHISVNITYEKIKNNESIIELKDNPKIWEYIQNKISLIAN